ncbi:MAG: hypothetical protein N3H30_00990 [Candidatus Micrarchaeota archaeon]|nr:hypothetical protein [Candidatus Micrarchaeota archaeon]
MAGKGALSALLLVVMLLPALQYSAGGCLIEKIPTSLKASENYDADTGQLIVYATLTYTEPSSGKKEVIAGQSIKFTLNYTDGDGEHIEETSSTTNAAGKATATFVIPGSESHTVKVKFAGMAGFKESEAEVSGGGGEMASAVQAELPEGINLVTCMPLLLLAGLLGAAMYASGQNPFGIVDFTAPQGIRTQRRLMKQTTSGWFAAGAAGLVAVGSIISGISSGAIKATVTKEEEKPKESATVKKEAPKDQERPQSGTAKPAAGRLPQEQKKVEKPGVQPQKPAQEGARVALAQDSGKATDLVEKMAYTEASSTAMAWAFVGALITALGGDFSLLRSPDFSNPFKEIWVVGKDGKERRAFGFRNFATVTALTKESGRLLANLLNGGRISAKGGLVHEDDLKKEMEGLKANAETYKKAIGALKEKKGEVKDTIAVLDAKKERGKLTADEEIKLKRLNDTLASIEAQLKDAQAKIADTTKAIQRCEEMLKKWEALQKDPKVAELYQLALKSGMQPSADGSISLKEIFIFIEKAGREGKDISQLREALQPVLEITKEYNAHAEMLKMAQITTLIGVKSTIMLAAEAAMCAELSGDELRRADIGKKELGIIGRRDALKGISDISSSTIVEPNKKQLSAEYEKLVLTEDGKKIIATFLGDIVKRAEGEGDDKTKEIAVKVISNLSAKPPPLDEIELLLRNEIAQAGKKEDKKQVETFSGLLKHVENSYAMERLYLQISKEYDAALAAKDAKAAEKLGAMLRQMDEQIANAKRGAIVTQSVMGEEIPKDSFARKAFDEARSFTRGALSALDEIYKERERELVKSAEDAGLKINRNQLEAYAKDSRTLEALAKQGKLMDSAIQSIMEPLVNSGAIQQLNQKDQIEILIGQKTLMGAYIGKLDDEVNEIGKRLDSTNMRNAPVIGFDPYIRLLGATREVAEGDVKSATDEAAARLKELYESKDRDILLDTQFKEKIRENESRYNELVRDVLPITSIPEKAGYNEMNDGGLANSISEYHSRKCDELAEKALSKDKSIGKEGYEYIEKMAKVVQEYNPDASRRAMDTSLPLIERINAIREGVEDVIKAREAVTSTEELFKVAEAPGESLYQRVYGKTYNEELGKGGAGIIQQQMMELLAQRRAGQ